MAKLLTGGIALIHGEQDKVSPTKVDLLIRGDRIVQIDANIVPPKDCQIIDCTNKLISPGFVDTHHHMWQTMLKGLFGNSHFMHYYSTIISASLKLTPEDLFWGTLAGCMEAIDAGTTTVLDHAHLNWSPNHSKPAIAGTVASGIRSIFAYSPTLLLQSTTPVAFSEELMPPWVMETMARLSKAAPFSDPSSRVKLGFGFDFWFLPQNIVSSVIQTARSYGAELVTAHTVKASASETRSTVQKAHEYGLLDDGFVFSHAGGATVEDIELLLQANAFVAVTPNTEQAMAVGPSVCFREDFAGADAICALGVDCHCATSSSMVNEMRMALQSARGMDSIEQRKKDTLFGKVAHTTEEAFNLGTIQGARALNMEKDVGRIAVGKKADLVVFDMMSPAMLGAAQADPVTAIVLHSNVGDIESVLVDGEYRKKQGKLLDVQMVGWEQEDDIQATQEKVQWLDVAQQILKSQRRIREALLDCDIDELE